MFRVFVGNLSPAATEADLLRVFAGFGPIASAKVARDRNDDRARGFGFVELTSVENGLEAVRSLQGIDIAGTVVTVSEARPRTDRPRREPGSSGIKQRRKPW